MIYVESEFARLQTVILAASEFGFPEVPRPEDLRFLTPEAREEVQQYRGRDHAEALPDVHRAWELEREALKRTLEKYSVKVLHPRKLLPEEKKAAGVDGYSNFFARDPFFTVGNSVVKGSMRFLHRRNEVLPIRGIIEKEVMPEDCHYVAVPRPAIAAPDDATLGPGPFLEGGDVLVLGKKVLVGNSGLASYASGVYITDPSFARVGEQVEAHGIKVEYIDFRINRSFGGSFRCSTQPLLRKD